MLGTNDEGDKDQILEECTGKSELDPQMKDELWWAFNRRSRGARPRRRGREAVSDSHNDLRCALIRSPRLMDRTCATCEGVLSVYERKAFLVDRYRCSGCGTKFDLTTSSGEALLLLAGVGLPLVVALAPDRKFARADDRWGIVAFLLAQAAVFVFFVVRSRRRAKRNPLRLPR